MRASRVAGLGVLASAASACFLSGYELAPRDADVLLGTDDAEVAATSPSGGPDAGDAADAGTAEPSCKPGEWCSYSCGGDGLPPCAFTCHTGELCQIHCEGALGCTGITCDRGATCAMFCDGVDEVGGCNAACEQGVTATACSAEAQAWCGNCAPLPPRLP